ncbi:hypothetical protein MPL1032_110177 [Mesorhizobium plurifarium]|uniref:Uncharacterized protein n=1 Tax=Mesorhizobium plurifarium TaxID=69974 RepID=A0A090G9M4_MESPL|nr:hypothetical protein MPL1032_110177 [Mesorhizobium plurifarium]CDX59843.1 hypothetical protein MPL3365_30881 [Mesorhizobium plurifarium]
MVTTPSAKAGATSADEPSSAAAKVMARARFRDFMVSSPVMEGTSCDALVVALNWSATGGLALVHVVVVSTLRVANR